MKVSKRTGKRERSILTSLITDSVVLGRIATIWHKDLFKSKWARLVAGWCVTYFNRYEEAPGKAINGLFESWATESNDKDSIALIEKYLEGVSEEYETDDSNRNSEYMIDQCSEFFNQVAIEELNEALQGDLGRAKVTDAIDRIHKFGKVELGVGAGINVLQDEDAMRTAFEHKTDPLIKWNGALGNFFGDAFERDSFIAFMGPEKRGKTWWLIETGWQGMLQRRKVAFFEVGDMSQSQILRRFAVRAAQRPMKPQVVKLPKFIAYNQGEPHAEVDFDEVDFNKPLNWRKAMKACSKVMDNKVKSNNSYLRLSTHPNSTISVPGMAAVLQGWERSGWVPDIIVIDYADILAPISGSDESREQVNKTWKAMRALSQTYHACVVTATQADAASYNSALLDRSNFSEDKRKFAHVNAMFGLNQTEDEKPLGLTRLNALAIREDAYSSGKCVHVAGCLAIGNVAIKSTF